MADLLIRNLPDDVADKLKSVASAEHMSVNALATRELTRVALGESPIGRNAKVMADLRAKLGAGTALDVETVLSAIAEGRR